MAHVPSCVITHTRRVCNMYKRMVRAMSDRTRSRVKIRYNAVLIRHEFDKHVNVKDEREIYLLLKKGDKWLEENEHYAPFRFPTAVEGIAWERAPARPDILLDYWHPMEKAFYPKYFAKREQLKKEYEEFYYKQYPDMRKVDKEKEAHDTHIPDK